MENRLEDIYNNISIAQYKTDIGFRTLVEGVNDYLYVIPGYQRKFKWEWEQVQELAVSLIRGLPIPPIYVWRNTKTGDLEILDGQQRVISLFLYYRGKYFKKKKENFFDYRLIDIENFNDFESALSDKIELEDRAFMMMYDKKEYDISYQKLPPKIRKRIDYTTISIIEIKISSESKIEGTIHEIFRYLNAGGTKLEPQEIRNGIYAGKFYNMLKDINVNNVKWRKLFGNDIDYNENDMKSLLRMCAYKFYATFNNGQFQIDNYKTQEKFLDEFSSEAVEFDERQVGEYRESLEKFINNVELEKKIDSLPVFEGIFVVTDKLSLNKNVTQNIYDEIKASVLDTLDQGTARRSKITRRWGKIYEFLSKND